MAYDIRMFKLITGEIVLGKYDAEKDCVTEAASLQNVPTQTGMQMLVLPYGFPFENKFVATVEGKFFMYRFSSTPQELQDKYIEVISNLTVSNGLGSLRFGNAASGPANGGSGLIH